MEIKTPFSDAIEKAPLTTKSTGDVKYDGQEIPDVPGRDGGYIPEVTRDTHWGSPKLTGPIDTPVIKDKVG